MSEVTTVTEPGRPPGTSSTVQIEDVDFLPERVAPGEVALARQVLDREGAVILTGYPVEPDSTVDAAAAMLGTRLRELEKVRTRTTENAEVLTLHRDGAHVVVDMGQQPVRLRLPDPDYVVVLSATSASAGGETVLVDGYRLMAQVRDQAPALHDFLTKVDVDTTSAIPRDDVHGMPRVCRLVEWTRGGRMIVRVAQHAQPAPRETDWDEHQLLIDAYEEVLADVAAKAGAGTVLAAGEVLVLDNYRCLHSVRPHKGPRTTHVLRCRSTDA